VTDSRLTLRRTRLSETDVPLSVRRAPVMLLRACRSETGRAEPAKTTFFSKKSEGHVRKSILTRLNPVRDVEPGAIHACSVGARRGRPWKGGI